MKWPLLVMILVARTGFAATPNPVILSLERSVGPQFVVRGEHRPAVSLAERMSQLNVNAVSIAVVRDRKLDWARAYGFADRERKIAATSDTRFQAGSISKPIAALAALLRVQAGSLDLHRNVNDYLKSWHLPDNEFTVVHKVTIQNILNHTAGLSGWGFPGYPRGKQLPSTVDVLEGKGNTEPVRVWKQPDLSWRYSGGGYTILQLLLCDQSGKSFPVMMRDAVLKPLHMDHSTYEQPLPESLRSTAASGYDGSGQKVEGDWSVYPEMAAAGLWTTPSDLAQYVIGMQKANLGDSSLLSASLARTMLTPGMNNHGLGPVITPDGLRFGHTGADNGFQAEMTGFLDGRGGIVVMTNSDNGMRLAREIVLTLGNLYGWSGMKPVERSIAEVPSAALDKLAGRYAMPSEDGDGKDDITVTRKEDTLVLSNDGETLMTLLPESDSKFFDRNTGRGVEFSFDGKSITLDIGNGLKAVRHGQL